MVERQVLIGGSRWQVEPMTKAKRDRFLKEYGLSKKARAEIVLRGYCDRDRKEIAFDKGQVSEDKLNTLLHEGLHAIINEAGVEMGIGRLNCHENEHAIYRLTAEILGYLKQIGAINPRFK